MAPLPQKYNQRRELYFDTNRFVRLVYYMPVLMFSDKITLKCQPLMRVDFNGKCLVEDNADRGNQRIKR